MRTTPVSNMTRATRRRKFAILGLVCLAAACSNNADDPAGDGSSAAAGNVQAAAADVSGKPGAPINIRYKVLGNAIVGQPVGISLEIFSASAGEQITVHYRINDATAMQFPESQSTSVEFRATRIEEPQIEQVTVIPQREGRLFLNVSAEIEGQDGSIFKSLAIPIQVDAAPQAPPTSGGLSEGPDVSTPAREQDGNRR